jgi:hypothetical protein
MLFILDVEDAVWGVVSCLKALNEAAALEADKIALFNDGVSGRDAGNL